SARNYFILANVLNEDRLNDAIIYFGKATSLNNDFACAYNNKALRHLSLNDYENAADSFIRCIKINPNHWCFYQLWFCLDELGEYEKAKYYAELGNKNNPNDIDLLFALGLANA